MSRTPPAIGPRDDGRACGPPGRAELPDTCARASQLSRNALRYGGLPPGKRQVKTPCTPRARGNGPRHNIALGPATFVDTAAEGPAATGWLGRLLGSPLSARQARLWLVVRPRKIRGVLVEAVQEIL